MLTDRCDENLHPRALARHRELLGRALHHSYGPGRTGTLADPVRAFSGLVVPRVPSTQSREVRERLAPYGLLFLQWEQRYPGEWRQVGWPLSPWSAKEAVLRAFCAGGPSPLTRAPLEALLVAAVRRPQRCQDRWYWELARRLDTPGLRGAITTAN